MGDTPHKQQKLLDAKVATARERAQTKGLEAKRAAAARDVMEGTVDYEEGAKREAAAKAPAAANGKKAKKKGTSPAEDDKKKDGPKKLTAAELAEEKLQAEITRKSLILSRKMADDAIHENELYDSSKMAKFYAIAIAELIDSQTKGSEVKEAHTISGQVALSSDWLTHGSEETPIVVADLDDIIRWLHGNGVHGVERLGPVLSGDTPDKYRTLWRLKGRVDYKGRPAKALQFYFFVESYTHFLQEVMEEKKRKEEEAKTDLTKKAPGMFDGHVRSEVPICTACGGGPMRRVDNMKSLGLIPCLCEKVQYCSEECRIVDHDRHQTGAGTNGMDKCNFVEKFTKFKEVSLTDLWKGLYATSAARRKINDQVDAVDPVYQFMAMMEPPIVQPFAKNLILSQDELTNGTHMAGLSFIRKERGQFQAVMPSIPWIDLVPKYKEEYLEEKKKRHLRGRDAMPDDEILEKTDHTVYVPGGWEEAKKYIESKGWIIVHAKRTKIAATVTVVDNPDSEKAIAKRKKDGTTSAEQMVFFSYRPKPPPVTERAVKAPEETKSEEKDDDEKKEKKGRRRREKEKAEAVEMKKEDEAETRRKALQAKVDEYMSYRETPQATRLSAATPHECYEEGFVPGHHPDCPILYESPSDVQNLFISYDKTLQFQSHCRLEEARLLPGWRRVMELYVIPYPAKEEGKTLPRLPMYFQRATSDAAYSYHRRAAERQTILADREAAKAKDDLMKAVAEATEHKLKTEGAGTAVVEAPLPSGVGAGKKKRGKK
jgi:hypothetical protein